MNGDPLAAVRGILYGLLISCAFWLVAVILPYAWSQGWRP